jgi:hypothetical protein
MEANPEVGIRSGVSSAAHACACGAIELGRKRQPASVFGSPEAIIESGADDAAAVTGKLAKAIVEAISGKKSSKDIRAAAARAARRFDDEKLAKPIAGMLLHGRMLGALDADWEAAHGKPVPRETFADLHSPWRALLGGIDPSFASRPMSDAIKRFLAKKAVTRETFDAMEAAAQREAFTVANAATEAMVVTVKRELIRAVAEGTDLRDFGTRAAERFEQAGWTPKNPAHLENVFRTNVVGAYNGGRADQMTQPEVMDLRPFWQILGISDGRQRKNHAAVDHVVLRASDPFWRTAYPPFGYFCRCRCRSLSHKQGAPYVRDGADFIGIVPDAGFTSGLGAVLAA